MFTGPDVRLTWLELDYAARIGAARQIASLRDGRRDAHGYGGDDGFDKHIAGVCGEMVVCKAYGIYWEPRVNVFKGQADIGERTEVRCRSLHSYDLIVRDDDEDPARLFVLVTGNGPLFVIRGWLPCALCKRDEWRHAHGGREAAWFVPQAFLHPPATFKVQ